MQTFKILGITVSENLCQIELPLREFNRMASKFDWRPILETEKALLYIDRDLATLFWAKKPHGGER
jgi:hypothetical protein